MISEEDVRRIVEDVKKLKHIPVPFADLVDCIINVDVREKYPEAAEHFLGYIRVLKALGFQEQEVVDIFFELCSAIYASQEIDGVMSDIKKHLESNQ